MNPFSLILQRIFVPARPRLAVLPQAGLISLLLLPGSFSAQAQTTRYVSTTGTNTNPASATSWATSTTNLQEAINASAANDQVWVAAGTYKPTITNLTVTFAMKNNSPSTVVLWAAKPA